MKIIIFSIYLATLTTFLEAKVEPPTQFFKWEMVEPYLVGQPLGKLKEAKPWQKKEGLYRDFIRHQKFKITVFFRVQDNKISETFIRLPSYFLHDVFHQMLIDQFGKQNKYKRKDEAAVFAWDKLKDYKVIYAGECTIQCFTSYLAILPKNQEPVLYNQLRL